MDAATASFWVPFFGFLGACATVGLPLLIRNQFNLASKREDEQEKLTRDLYSASEFCNRLYARYEDDHARFVAISEGLKEWRQKNPDADVEFWHYIIMDIAARPMLKNEFRDYLMVENQKSLGRRRGEEKDGQ